jgi:hypothetical protein
MCCHIYALIRQRTSRNVPEEKEVNCPIGSKKIILRINDIYIILYYIYLVSLSFRRGSRTHLRGGTAFTCMAESTGGMVTSPP